MKSLQVKSYAEACEWGSGEARGRVPSGSFCPNGYSLRQALERNVGQAGCLVQNVFRGEMCPIPYKCKVLVDDSKGGGEGDSG